MVWHKLYIGQLLLPFKLDSMLCNLIQQKGEFNVPWIKYYFGHMLLGWCACCVSETKKVFILCLKHENCTAMSNNKQSIEYS